MVQGGMGIAAGGNINPDGVSMFEPIGGSAPKYTGKNVINPLAVVITSISLEHTNVLGNKISEIAQEKAAIIKKGTKVLLQFFLKKQIMLLSKNVKKKIVNFSGWMNI